MSNALGNLFQDIADAIKEKTGNAATMKPAEFADNIRAIEIGGGSSADVRYVTFMSHDGTVEYGKKAVAVGDNCADPIARGLFDTPTRESSAQYNYTFNGWSATVGGSASSTVLNAVTEDKTVYAAYTSSIRYYTITYYDGSTVLKTESLAYGTMPSYTPEKDGYNFEGWSPALAAVTGNASYYAQFSSALTFAGASWADIARISEEGTAADYFAVGDERVIPLTYADGTAETITVAIAGFNHDTISNSTTKAGISIVCKSVPSVTATWGGSGYYYNSCKARTALSGTILPALPAELQNVIKAVSKSYDRSSSTSASPTLGTVNDKLWLLSVDELGQVSSGSSPAANNIGSQYMSKLGNKYALFASGDLSNSNNQILAHSMVTDTTTKATYWTRHIKRPGETQPCYVGPYSSNSKYSFWVNARSALDTTAYYLRFGFCI